MAQRINRCGRFPRVSVRIGLRGRRREVRKYEAAVVAPIAQPPEQPREVVVEKPKDYKTPEHGFDWRSMPPLPVDIAAYGCCGLMDCATGGVERETPEDLVGKFAE